MQMRLRRFDKARGEKEKNMCVACQGSSLRRHLAGERAQMGTQCAESTVRF
jgi:hypothetical protein